MFGEIIGAISNFMYSYLLAVASLCCAPITCSPPLPS